ncbi:MAG: cation-transporting P-type ATPase [Planctomycetota bacterium]|nr:cation-transporting P-type ATPase [Planctomycetota bacterium]
MCPATEPPPWHSSSAEAAAAELRADLELGLSAAEAAARLAQSGPNRIEEQRRSTWPEVLGRQFVDVLVGILAVAAAVAFLLGDTTDGLTILAIVLLNGGLGFVQEWRAERALAALRRLLAPHCEVIRDGRAVRIDADQLVPGDLVVLGAGDRVPADVRVVDALQLACDESALTGESVPVPKRAEADPVDAPLAERSAVAFLGTVVTAGHGRGLVIATGARTAFGQVAHLTASVQNETTPLQRTLARLGHRLGLVAVLLAATVTVLGALGGQPLDEMFLTGVSLAVALVPEGLPAVVTLTLALGVRAMTRRRALVRRLQAAEALGATTVLCTDKTGTLTCNEMTVREIWLAAGSVSVEGQGYDPTGGFATAEGAIEVSTRTDLELLLDAAVRCTHARIERSEDGAFIALGDPTEAALVTAAHKADLVRPDAQPFAELPFDADRKRMSVAWPADGDGWELVTKGAPDVLLDLCTGIQDGARARPIEEVDRNTIRDALDALAARGLRVLAVARRGLSVDPRSVPDLAALEVDLTLLGLAAMSDPPRAGVRESVAAAHRAGVRVLVITGDAPATAEAIAREVGIEPTATCTGTDLEELDDRGLEDLLRTGEVLFARTTPAHKLRIVEALQSLGEVVGMTGDGVNDAPALKRADVGVAMGRRGTDVARAAADLILTDDDFPALVSAVEEGRRQFDGIRKFLANLLSSNSGEVIALLGSVGFGGPLIFVPAQLLWINLVTDGLTSLALGAEPVEPDTMRRPPRRPGGSILSRTELSVVLAQGLWIGAGTFAVFVHLLGQGVNVERARSVAFTAIVLGELLNAWNYRSFRLPLAEVGAGSNPWFTAAFTASIGLQLTAITTPALQTAFHLAPLEPSDWLLIAAVALPVLGVTEITKAVLRRRGGRP